MLQPILVNGTRILRPQEYEQLLAGVACSRFSSRDDHALILKVLFLSGLSYSDAARLQVTPKWFSNRVVSIPGQPPLSISPRLCDLLPFFFRSKKMPTRNAWIKNLRRWANAAGLSPDGLNVKTSRKTWAAWYISYHRPVKIPSAATSLIHALYLLKFNEDDLVAMQKYVGD